MRHEKIIKARRDKNLRVSELGELAFIELKRIIDIEMGVVKPTGDELLAIAEALNTTIAYLNKHNWAGLSIEKLSKRYERDMNAVRMAMGQIALEHGKPKSKPSAKAKPMETKGDKSTCASPKCQATIQWIKTIAGEKMCVDPGVKTIIDKNTGEVATGFTPHWATCKDPSYFRKKKGKP